jgi:hypothetical protein
MPLDVCAWLVQRGGVWVLYIAEQVLNWLDGKIPGTECVIVPNWRAAPGQ